MQHELIVEIAAQMTVSRSSMLADTEAARSFMRRGRFSVALRILQPYIELGLRSSEQLDPHVFAMATSCAYHMDDTDLTRRYLNAFIEAHPENARALHLATIISLNEGKMNEAEQYFQQLKNVDPDSNTTYRLEKRLNTELIDPAYQRNFCDASFDLLDI